MTLPTAVILPINPPDEYARRLNLALADAFRRIAHEVNRQPAAALVLAGAWTASAGYAAPAAIVSGSGLVVLQGVAAGGTAGSTVSSLPAGLRPSVDRLFPVATGSGAGTIAVRSDGSIVLTAGGGWCSLDGISFYAT